MSTHHSSSQLHLIHEWTIDSSPSLSVLSKLTVHWTAQQTLLQIHSQRATSSAEASFCSDCMPYCWHSFAPTSLQLVNKALLQLYLGFHSWDIPETSYFPHMPLLTLRLVYKREHFVWGTKYLFIYTSSSILRNFPDTSYLTFSYQAT